MEAGGEILPYQNDKQISCFEKIRNTIDKLVGVFAICRLIFTVANTLQSVVLY